VEHFDYLLVRGDCSYDSPILSLNWPPAGEGHLAAQSASLGCAIRTLPRYGVVGDHSGEAHSTSTRLRLIGHSAQRTTPRAPAKQQPAPIPVHNSADSF
jgi:hypothetical protein